MAEPTTTNKQAMKDGVTGEAGTPHVFTIEDHESGDDGDPFYKWPSLPTEPAKLPAEFLETIKTHRDQIGVIDGIGPYQSGFSHKGENRGVPPTPPLLDANDMRQYSDPVAQQRVVPILEWLPHEITGEGGASAAMTGDSAKFTWGHGLTRTLATKAFRIFLSKSWNIKKAFLNHGIALDGEDWKFVDLATGAYKQGDAALGFIDGNGQPAVQKNLISIFVKLTQDHLQQAEDAQWRTWKDFFFAHDNKPPESVVKSEAWTPKAVCYVIHCAGWGRFPKWDKFVPTNGDPRKILRVEADCTYHYDEPGHMFVMQDYKQDNGKMVHPSTTMVFNMGHGLMYEKGFLTPCQDAKSVTNGDAVFEIHKDWRKLVGGAPFGVLKDVPRQVTGTVACKRPLQGEEEYRSWVAANQGKSMKDLLAACEARGYKLLKDTRDWYGALIQDPAYPNDDTKKIAPNEAWGLRPRVAMDAVLHKGGGSGSAWILDEAARVGITSVALYDQWALLREKLKIS